MVLYRYQNVDFVTSLPRTVAFLRIFWPVNVISLPGPLFGPKVLSQLDMPWMSLEWHFGDMLTRCTWWGTNRQTDLSKCQRDWHHWLQAQCGRNMNDLFGRKMLILILIELQSIPGKIACAWLAHLKSISITYYFFHEQFKSLLPRIATRVLSWLVPTVKFVGTRNKIPRTWNYQVKALNLNTP